MMQELTLTGATLLSDTNTTQQQQQQQQQQQHSIMLLNTPSTTTSSTMTSTNTGIAGTYNTNSNTNNNNNNNNNSNSNNQDDHPYLMFSLTNVTGDHHNNHHNNHHHSPNQNHHNHDPHTGTHTTSDDDDHHKKPCCSQLSKPILHRPMLTLKKSAKDIVENESTTNYDLYHLILQIIRFGSYELFLDVMETWETHYNNTTTTTNTTNAVQQQPKLSYDQIIHAYDRNGHTLLHWASKRIDDIRIVQYLLYNIQYQKKNSRSSLYIWNNNNNNETEEQQLIPFDIQVPSSITTIASSMNTTGSTTTTNTSSSTTAASIILYPTPIHRPTNDNTRMTSLHWACTQENGLSMIKVLLDASITLTTTTATTTTTTMNNGNCSSTTTSLKNNNSNNNNNTSTTTTTNNSIPTILEIRDGTGCTPCLIAAQHGRVEIVAYLLQRGANIYAVDQARDSMIHWASYKGSEHVLGLLSYYCSHQQFYTPDTYGQTPLHLASLRGHVSVVRYILHHLLQQPLLAVQQQQQQQQQGHDNYTHNNNNTLVNILQHQQQSMQQRMACARAVRDLLLLPDQNGRTPYDLAVHKNKPAVAAVLKLQLTSLQNMLLVNPSSIWWGSQILRQYISYDNIKQLCLLRTWKSWLGLPEVDDLDESPRFPFYYVIGQIIGHIFFTFGIFIPMFDISKGVLWDYMIMLMINSILIFISAYSLYLCHTTNPGRLDTTFPNLSYWRRLYEQTLDAFASSDETIAKHAATVPLCHTCHIARPPRSKHDRFSRSCILQFDHHCPFVGTTIGLYNYKWFFMFIVAISIYFINFWIMLIVYYLRTSSDNHKSTLTFLFGIYLGLHILFSGGMVIYHSQLIYANLTTNEHIHLGRYDYLWDTTSSSSRRVFSNPWDKGCLNNMYDRFILPGDHCYLVPTTTDQHESSRTLNESSVELYQPLVKRMVETV